MSERKGTKALELWCKRLVKDCSDVQIDNMTTSWRNGLAFCALVHHFRPDLIDISKLKPENIYENNQLAFSIAEKHLGIPALLDPEDMVENDVPDRLSILTYLSQFYQRLGHKVTPKPSDNDPTSPVQSTSSTGPFLFGKTGLDKCAFCDLPVYLAQRLIVEHKLYHRRCFRCSKCSGHLNPNNIEFNNGSEFTCDSCKSENTLSKYLNNNNNDQMGMLAFNDDLPKARTDAQTDKPSTTKRITRPQSVLEKISIFENNVEKETKLDNKLNNLSLKDNLDRTDNKLSNIQIDTSINAQIEVKPLDGTISSEMKNIMKESDKVTPEYKNPDKAYKSNVEQINFLKTQLVSDTLEPNMLHSQREKSIDLENKEDCVTSVLDKNYVETEVLKGNDNVLNKDSNITDDKRLAINNIVSDNHDIDKTKLVGSEQVPGVTLVPPKRKKHIRSPDKNTPIPNEKKRDSNLYPEHLNPFSDDEEEEEDIKLDVSKSTNPFGSSEDEEGDNVPPIHSPAKIPTVQTQATPTKRLIAANPFWSDGEEPSSDEETEGKSSRVPAPAAHSTPRRSKGRAPPPPPAAPPPALVLPATSTDDVASLSSMSSYNSTVLSDQKCYGSVTPKLKKKRPAPSPSNLSVGGSMERGMDGADNRSTTSDGARRAKGPAPGLPLPARREIKLQMSPAAIQEQLDVLETQQLGLERQGVLIERMIRDKCEGDTAGPVPQEEVEDLVIQLCELVNEKNDLFRKQTELMYIRRQQRLEQEQADIEHEIRVIQSRPAVNRIDADKAREEQLVSRLVEIVHLRDQLVQQMEAERRRERQEDCAIASSIASKRAQRNSESNSSSMKSIEVVQIPKKSKVKDKVKRQLKKAKHSLIPRKKDDSEKKEDKAEKERKSK